MDERHAAGSGRQAMRISVSNYRTDEADVDATVESILSAVARA